MRLQGRNKLWWNRSRPSFSLYTPLRSMCLATLKVAIDYHKVIIYLIGDVLRCWNLRNLTPLFCNIVYLQSRHWQVPGWWASSVGQQQWQQQQNNISHHHPSLQTPVIWSVLIPTHQRELVSWYTCRYSLTRDSQAVVSINKYDVLQVHKNLSTIHHRLVMTRHANDPLSSRLWFSCH